MNSGGSFPGEGLQDLAQTRYVFLLFLAVRYELASVTIAVAIAYCAGNSNGFTGIRKRKLNFDLAPHSQFQSHQHAQPPLAQLYAPPVSYQCGFLFAENNPEWNIDFVAYGASFVLVRSRQTDNFLSGHNPTLAVWRRRRK